MYTNLLSLICAYLVGIWSISCGNFCQITLLLLCNKMVYESKAYCMMPFSHIRIYNYLCNQYISPLKPVHGEVYSIHKDVKEAKYLGDTLSSNLTWNTHITGKANKLLRFLRRNLKIRNQKGNNKGERIQSDSQIKSRIMLYGMVTTYQNE